MLAAVAGFGHTQLAGVLGWAGSHRQPANPVTTDSPDSAAGSISLTAWRGHQRSLASGLEQGGTARVVRHGYESWFSGWHPPADESWKIVERAEFPLKLQPRLPYNLVGHNCEIIADMCVSDGWTESYQARKFFLVRTMMDAALLFWLASRRRAKLSIPRWASPVMVRGSSSPGSFWRLGSLFAEAPGGWFLRSSRMDPAGDFYACPARILRGISTLVPHGSCGGFLRSFPHGSCGDFYAHFLHGSCGDFYKIL